MSLIAEYFFTFIIFILPIIYVVQPFFMQGFGKIISSESLEILKRKKIILYRQIKELEMEYDIGNLESDDFKNRRAELKSEVSLIIDKIKKK
ncbi:MAG: hypothetical protein VXX68_01645 [Candidatus Neomarinimicrobiota bacterium]|nr:hypothetical protein [Candidatus Neomarinimicrobiota bacterium]|tara:strand:+ start:808 stop:1083 length:276 start_codon:yes stop_codon:yes gene_type:complete